MPKSREEVIEMLNNTSDYAQRQIIKTTYFNVLYGSPKTNLKPVEFVPREYKALHKRRQKTYDEDDHPKETPMSGCLSVLLMFGIFALAGFIGLLR